MSQARVGLFVALVGFVVSGAGVARAQSSGAAAQPPADQTPADQTATTPPPDTSASTSTSTSTSASTSTSPSASPSTSGAAATATASGAVDDEETHCDAPPAFDPSSPRLDLSVGGGYAAYFVTWRQVADSFNAPGAHVDGLYHGPLVRGEVELGLGAFSLSVNYTHIFSQHDGTAAAVDWALLSGELGLQCACTGSSYVWGFGLEVGWDLNNNTVFAGIEHRSQWFVWEGLFLGFDFDVAVLVGLTSHGASGGGFEGSIFLGYSIG